jgi:hypothetical protein
MDFAYRVFKFLGSLKMAVIIILALAVLSAVGTFLESRYNTEFAQVLVYKSWWMYVTMILLSISLIFSAVERLPWKKRHLPFLVAHVGLLVLILGSYLTQKVGIDGTLTLGIGGKGSMVSITPKDLSLYASHDGDSFKLLYQQEVDFISNDPKENQIEIPIETGKITVKEFHAFAIPDQRVVRANKEWDRPAIRFLLKNANVNFSDWMVLDRPTVQRDLGPAVLVFSKDYDKNYFPKKNTIYFHLNEKGRPAYKIFKSLNDRAVKQGDLHLGKAIETPWMGMKLSLLSFYEKARREVVYEPREYPSGITQSAIKVEYKGDDYWLGLNSIIKFFTESTAYVLSWGNRQIDLGFSIQLKEFKMDKYMGTDRAASYASIVKLPDGKEVEISMNEPLKYRGFTFYQASFQQGETGEPTASILSVNYDPGRSWKYIGSLLVVLGSIMLFYFRRQMAKK